jgi:hypothetical protein
MNGHAAFVRRVGALSVTLSLCAAGSSAFGTEANVTRTNWVERWITNLVEVRMPLNRFVNEYHTNWVTQFHTNVVNVYTTNFVTRTLTNHFLVDAFRTNFVTAYQTNWRTLDLTNWQTAIVMTTNWVTQSLTNVVQVDLPKTLVAKEAVVSGEAAEPKEAKTETAASPLAASMSGPVVLEAARTTRPPHNDQVEVQLNVRGNSDPAPILQVKQWRVEREDRAILCFGQDQEFKRELPAGRYKVEVKVRQDEQRALLTVRGTLVVTPGEALIQQNLAARK